MKNKIKLNRRNFLKRAGGIGAALAFSKPLYALSKLSSDSKVDKLKLLDFAHVTDVHITDGTKPLRADLLDNIPGLHDAWRPQQHMSATALDAVIRSINQQDDETSLDFVVCTGDIVDNAMQNEFQWFMDVVDGNEMSDDYKKLVTEQVVTPVNPQGLNSAIPWYAAIGNHDTMIVGNFPAKLMEVIYHKMEERYEFEITTQEEVIDILYDHGFSNMPNYMDGYYSFDPDEYAHCIVLNTNNDNWIEGVVDKFFSSESRLISSIIKRKKARGRKTILIDILKLFTRWLETQTHEVIGGIAQGTLDRDQFAWMKQEIEENSNKLCLLFSHHGPNSFLSPIGNVTPNELKNTLCSYDNVIAHIFGHIHRNLITKEENAYGNYWSVSTCSIIEYPQEWRRISLWDNGDGTGLLSCRMFRHEYGESLNASMNDPHSDIETHVGRLEDRDVDLEFDIPLSVADLISNSTFGGANSGI